MTSGTKVRQAHRWLSMIFTGSVVVTFVVLMLDGAEWVSYLPLAPLMVLMFSGLYLFALPYRARRRT